MNGTTTIAEFREAVLDPAKRAHYRLAWLSTVDHKRIAVLYMLTALVFFVIGGTEALFIRLQLIVPNNHFLQPDTFNQLFTMHGTTMIFLVVMPVVFGLANYVLPLLLIDRQLQGHFLLPSRGGSPVLWQHIFWAFGHPEVYIMALPAFAIVAEIIPVFSRKPIFGYEFVAASSVAIAVLSLGVWGHHMFTVGMGRPLDVFFAISSMLIAIPTGVKVLNWTATMIGGRIRFQVPMLFCIAFLIQFLVAGLTGVSHASVALDWQTKNSYFLVAHFHFVAVGAIVFAVIGGLQYWFPKMSGRMLSERLGKWTFWLMVIGFNMTFIIQHFLGLLGMPRRVYTYPDLRHWGWMNMVSTSGVFFMSAAALILVWNLATSFFRGKVAGDNPWSAWTLEWATTSPPPHENFVALPPIRSRRPLWDLANPDRPDPIVGENSAAVTLPDHNKVGILSFILSETGFFAALILAYLYFYARPQAGPGPKELDVPRTLVFSVCLFASSFTFWRSEVALTKQLRGSMLGWLALTILLGGIFLVGQGTEYWKLFQTGVDLSTNLFSTTFFTLTGFHGLHVFLGLVALLILLWVAWQGDFALGRASAFAAAGYYWHFVDIVWVFVLLTVYILPLIR